MCESWLNSPCDFALWAVENGFREGLTIDRIDSTKDYNPDNCRWITREDNARRAGKVNWITVDDETLTGRQWSQKLNYGINYINTMIRKNGIDYTINFIKMKMQE